MRRQIRYIGPVDVAGKNELFARARALLHLNTIPERFGLVLAEANAAGVPVIAMDLGSCREVIEDGETGFLVNNVNEAVRALERLAQIDRSACRQRVQQWESLPGEVPDHVRPVVEHLGPAVGEHHRGAVVGSEDLGVQHRAVGGANRERTAGGRIPERIVLGVALDAVPMAALHRAPPTPAAANAAAPAPVQIQRLGSSRIRRQRLQVRSRSEAVACD